MNTFSNLTQNGDGQNFQIDMEPKSRTDLTERSRNVRIIHCGDGIVEECSEDEEEKERAEEEARRKQAEARHQMDIQAVSTFFKEFFFNFKFKLEKYELAAVDVVHGPEERL